MAEARIRAATAADAPAIRALLQTAGLPVEDLTPSLWADFLLAEADGQVLAAGTVEPAADGGLLRSVVVAPAARRSGLGRRLVAALEARARRRGQRSLYLLTMDAQDYFRRLGYAPQDRAAAPTAIRATAQFSGLCPASSHFLGKTLGPANVLILCTGNSARSILGEVLINQAGAASGAFRGYSAGSRPRGEVNPDALALLRELGYATDGLRSKPWDEFSAPGAPVMDYVFTVCDAAAGETCPYWPGTPLQAHWGLPDPAAVEGSDAQRRDAFLAAYEILQRRVARFAALPFAQLDEAALRRELQAIGRA